MTAGTPGGTRTPGPLLRRQLLYPPELQAHIMRALWGPRAAVLQAAWGKEGQRNERAFGFAGSEGCRACPDAGAGDGNRTHATSLEGWDSTIELHPHKTTRLEAVSFSMIASPVLFVNPFFLERLSFLPQ